MAFLFIIIGQGSINVHEFVIKVVLEIARGEPEISEFSVFRLQEYYLNRSEYSSMAFETSYPSLVFETLDYYRHLILQALSDDFYVLMREMFIQNYSNSVIYN